MMCQRPSVFCSLAADWVPEILVNGVILLIVDQGSVMFNKDRLRRTIPPVFNFKSAPIYINLAAFVSNFFRFFSSFYANSYKESIIPYGK